MDQPNPIPELTPYLKQLRLSGLLETLAQRNRETALVPIWAPWGSRMARSLLPRCHRTAVALL